ncbi:hypothetical protein J7426_13495 [Tropicibacter sp. R16_0]|nr:hypothetical protein [Tropicibacter sp. R16_0]MBO9451280.1 hypothetical protein [Tropicibacter sp. R16_0]
MPKVANAPSWALEMKPVVFVVLANDAAPDLDTAQIFCAHDLSCYKLPIDLKTISEIPRTGSGKIMRFKLRDLF